MILRAKPNTTFFSSFIILLVLVITGCKHEPAVLPEDPFTEIGNGNGNGNGNGGGGEEEQVICDSSVVYFQQQVLPILTSNCAVPGCKKCSYG